MGYFIINLCKNSQVVKKCVAPKGLGEIKSGGQEMAMIIAQWQKIYLQVLLGLSTDLTWIVVIKIFAIELLSQPHFLATAFDFTSFSY